MVIMSDKDYLFRPILLAGPLRAIDQASKDTRGIIQSCRTCRQ